jgi:periplasmic protein TonB
MTRVQMRRLGPCIAITVAVHAVLLAVPMRPAAASSARSTAPPVMQTRLIVSSVTAPERADTTLHSSATDRTLSAGYLSAPVLTRSALALESHPAIEPAIFVPIAEPSLLGISFPGVANEDDQYVVRSLLTLPPVPLAPVVIDFPDFKGEANRYVAELTLFIDESGVVVRVKAEGNSLPSPLEEAARNAFMRARFRPGELTDLGAVKSRIRVEVVFESGVPRPFG